MFSVQIQQGVKYNQHFVAVTFKIVFKNKQIRIYIQGHRFIWAWFYVGLQACVNVHGGIPGAFNTGTNKLFLSSYIVWEGGEDRSHFRERAIRYLIQDLISHVFNLTCLTSRGKRRNSYVQEKIPSALFRQKKKKTHATLAV